MAVLKHIDLRGFKSIRELELRQLNVPRRIGTLLDDRTAAVARLAEECEPFANPELINHGQHSHPKARIRKYVPEYEENVHGPLLAGDIGLYVLREKCPHFGAWLARLERLDDA